MIAFCQGTGGNSTLRDPIAMSAVESTFEWHYFIRNPWLIEDKVFINLTVCKPEDFPSIVSESYSVRLFQNCMCASKASLANYNISFFNTDTYASYFTYKLMFKNEIFNNPAAYQNYSNYYRNNPQRLFTYFIDSNANVNDYNSPFTSFINYDFTYLSPDISYSSELYFSDLQVNLDDNYFIEGKFYLY